MSLNSLNEKLFNSPLLKNQFRNNCSEKLEIGDKIKIIIRSTIKKEKGDHYFIPFEGVIIAKKNENKISYSVKILKKGKINIEVTFFYHSPLIESIKKEGKINRKIRRAKLNYLKREKKSL